SIVRMSQRIDAVNRTGRESLSGSSVEGRNAPRNPQPDGSSLEARHRISRSGSPKAVDSRDSLPLQETLRSRLSSYSECAYDTTPDAYGTTPGSHRREFGGDSRKKLNLRDAAGRGL